MLSSKTVLEKSGVAFGTSGARGLVKQFTNDVCAAFACSFVDVCRVNFNFDEVAIAIDNRPSSLQMAQACASAIEALGCKVRYYGVIPTPALAYAAMQQNIPSIMVTGSHIPFDRNGLKFYRPDGEITKADEIAIHNSDVEFESKELAELLPDDYAANLYIERYKSIFDDQLLTGKKIGIYEHSSAGRDLYPDLFRSFGAEVISLERSDEFIPIDTEAVSDEDKLKAKSWSDELALDAIFSTDGDGDRPLVAGEDGVWLNGDILGLLCSKGLAIEALAVPVSCNTAIELAECFSTVTRTRIGSPHVIAEFGALSESYDSVAGFEANGGYLLGCDVLFENKVLKALPTRDALLPALILFSMAQSSSIVDLVNELPQRYTQSDRIKNFATEKSKAILSKAIKAPEILLKHLGFETELLAVDSTDGLRITLADQTIVHLRPSGNAPELRCYAEAENFSIAKKIVEQALDKIISIEY